MTLNADDWLAVVLIDNEGTAHLRDSGEIPPAGIAAALRELAQHLAPYERLEVDGTGQAEVVSTELCTLCGFSRLEHDGSSARVMLAHQSADPSLEPFEQIPVPSYEHPDATVNGAPRFVT